MTKGFAGNLHTIVSFPLTVVGGIAGRGNAPPFEAPCRTTKGKENSGDAGIEKAKMDVFST